MTLQTYAGFQVDSIVHLYPRVDNAALQPSDWVTYRAHPGTQGIVVAVNVDPKQITVLWSVAPPVQSGLITQNIVSVQPMTAPSGLIFYLDYTYGDDERKRRCNSGSGWRRMVWKGYYRCLQAPIRSLSSSWSRFSSWLVSRGGASTGVRRLCNGPK